MTGPNGAARVQIGSSCVLSLAADTDLHIDIEGKTLCVRAIDHASTADIRQTPNAAGAPLIGPATIPTVIMGGTMALGFAMDATQNPVSR